MEIARNQNPTDLVNTYHLVVAIENLPDLIYEVIQRDISAQLEAVLLAKALNELVARSNSTQFS